MSATVADATERARALDPEASFIVQAPAGSGKTYIALHDAVAFLRPVFIDKEVAKQDIVEYIESNII